MSLKEYFQVAKGTGVISTSDGDGKVNSAIYSRPYVIDEETVAFIIANRLTRGKVQVQLKLSLLLHCLH